MSDLSINGMLRFPDNGPPRVVYGTGAADRIGELARTLGTRRALLVTDQHIVEAGHAPRAANALRRAGVEVTLYDAVQENPTTDDVDACLAAARSAGNDLFVALGGGSTLDTAKGANFLLTNGGRMHDYRGRDKATKPMLPLIAAPTTAGTGSECQSFALIADAKTHQKMACGDTKALPAFSILDPLLTLTQPPVVAADTGVDALAHALETAVTTRRTDESLRYAREAFKLVQRYLPRVFDTPDDLEARGRMLLAAAYAGTAIERSMLGAAHAAANPLSAHFNVIHGQAVGVMLIPVVRFNAQDPTAKLLYADLAAHAELVPPGATPDAAVEALLTRLDQLLASSGLPRTLADFDIPADALPALADEAAEQWTANFNPRPLTPADFIALYQSAGPRP